ncbi:BCCT family transporter [Pseudomonas benzenivorans]|uniref:BCCT family transporter n=1 Tax=Pseudomonas benzenivorans TaxID=556533 RepID=A0ABY5H9Y8_9PSED|nr:BCCT family transporter [Pseudomonas benzenivorans]UTW08192.1 BCCT family transporter [Pseudomonas benzenivorans]
MNNKCNIARQGFLSGSNPSMAILSKLVVLAFLIFTIYDPEYAGSLYGGIKDAIQSTFDWLYVGLIGVMFFLCIWLATGKRGDIRLGADNEKAEFSYFAWFAMLFGAGMGIAMLFWSIAEPMYHFQGNPFIEMAGIAPNSVEAAQVAMRISFFHWGFHGWAIYAVAGLAMAYFAYRKGLPLTIRSALYPILGERIYGPIGHAVDILGIFATVFGVATSLGLGVSQMNAGLNYLFGMEISTTNQIILIIAISVLATTSAVSGVAKGIRILSEWNVKITTVILAFFLIAGPTTFLLGLLSTSFGDYIWNMVPISFWVDPNPEGQWQGWWTVFYWGWYIAWTPFVGMFIARISRGRTVREFLVGVIVIPSLVSFIWLALFGGTALHMELYGAGGIVDAVNNNLTTALYVTIEKMTSGWLAWLVAALATLLIVTWFVTSADSGTLVICTLLAIGDKEPPRKFRIIWGMGLGAVAAVLLLAGGLKALQAASIAAALPFSIVLILMIYGLVKSLIQNPEHSEVEVYESSETPAPKTDLQNAL